MPIGINGVVVACAKRDTQTSCHRKGRVQFNATRPDAGNIAQYRLIVEVAVITQRRGGGIKDTGGLLVVLDASLVEVGIQHQTLVKQQRLYAQLEVEHLLGIHISRRARAGKLH